jgi:hypothetical protein
MTVWNSECKGVASRRAFACSDLGIPVNRFFFSALSRMSATAGSMAENLFKLLFTGRLHGAFGFSCVLAVGDDVEILTGRDGDFFNWLFIHDQAV